MLRLFAGFDSGSWRTLGASLNAGTIVLFALTVALAALSWGVKHRTRR
jgi:ABC-type transport system involved in cytochrome c biogenesis permease component